MNIATGVMNTLLPKLVDLVVGEYKLQKGVKGEIKELEEELTSMDAALRKVSKVPSDQLDEQVKIWARDVRELSYDIEDAVDSFILRIKRHDSNESFSFKGLIARTTDLLKNAKTNHKIHNVIKDILDQVKKVSQRRDRYKVDDVATSLSTVTVDPRLEAVYLKVTDLVGIEGPKNDLAEKLIDDEGNSSGQHLKIISIVGFGGLGKTTLANALFYDHKSKFDCHAFVTISLNPDINMVLRNMLRQLDKDKYKYINEACDLMQLINMIIEFLVNKRGLFVIDDVWNESAWDTIKLALQEAKQGSKIVITTRNKAVAEYTGGYVYEIKSLSHEDSRKLLHRRIFGTEDGCPNGLKEVSDKILKKCGGVPLAIITIASLLASKPIHLMEWENVNNYIVSGLERSHNVDKMKKILMLGYNDLPFHLKACFLYLALYPEDKEIEKDSLVSSWIAEGFITEMARPSGTTLRDIGELYFSELINRSLIQPVNSIYELDGLARVCQVHDIVLELITQLAAEEGFATRFLSDGRQADTPTPAAQRKQMRRLSLYNCKMSYAPREGREQWCKLRSLVIFGKVNWIPSLSNFHVLRMLHLEDCTDLDDNYLNDLSKLRHLKFLRLGNCSRIPESIGQLQSLETLETTPTGYGKAIIRHHHMVMLPISCVKLQKLVRLSIVNVSLPVGLPLGDMESLQELVGVDIYSLEDIKGIGNLKELRVLQIFVRGDIVPEAIFMCLQKCAKFKDLRINAMKGPLSWSLDSEPYVPTSLQRFMYCGTPMAGFPIWINSSMLPCLTTLSIRLSEPLQPQHLEKLAELPSLCFLHLWLYRFPSLEQELIITNSGFQCLRHLQILLSSVVYMFQLGAMPRLQRLSLYLAVFSKDLVIPLGMENLHSLRLVMVDEEEAVPALREVLKDNPNRPLVENMN